MTQQEMLFLVPQKLKEIEKEYGIQVLYAVESGSRAWGTNSQQSDFDVRFIYTRPPEAYLRLDPLRDVLEFPIADGWDICGWDLTKTLRLLHNSNSQIYEWFASPVVYVDTGFSHRFQPILDAYFSTKTTAKHYLHQSDLKSKKRTKTETPKVKHYLYSLQHIAAAKWALQYHVPVPVSFQALMKLLQETIQQMADVLLQQKTTQPDQPFVSCCPELEDWLLQERDQISSKIDTLPRESEKDWDMLNRFFLSELQRETTSAPV